MASLRRQNAFEKFFENRSFLIKMYENNSITKREFLELNYDAIRKSPIRPFVKIDSFEKGLYNYQYYNSLAKYYKTLARELKMSKNAKRDRNTYLNKCNHFYHQKDISSYKLIKYLEFRGVEAYFVETKSPGLRGKLYEIVLKDFDEAIFHSKSEWLLEKLRDAGVFIEGKHESVISEYINERY